MKSLILLILLSFASYEMMASSFSTQWNGFTDTVAVKIESYARNNNGELPEDLNNLFSGFEKARMEEVLGGEVSKKLLYYKQEQAEIIDSKTSEKLKIVAVIAFPIDEDWRNEMGRYVVCKSSSGEMSSRWFPDSLIEKSLATIEKSLPQVPVYQEKSRKKYDPEYVDMLFADAMNNHEMSPESIDKILAKHVQDIVAGKAKRVKSWKDLLVGTSEADSRDQTKQPPAVASNTTSTIPMNANLDSSDVKSITVSVITCGVLVLFAVIFFFVRRK